MEQLGLYPQYWGPGLSSSGGPVPAPTNATLHQFENAIANMTALMYWSCRFICFEYDYSNMLIWHWQWEIQKVTHGLQRQPGSLLTQLVYRCSKVQP
jgi:hypothetical protein